MTHKYEQNIDWSLSTIVAEKIQCSDILHNSVRATFENDFNKGRKPKFCGDR